MFDFNVDLNSAITTVICIESKKKSVAGGP